MRFAANPLPRSRQPGCCNYAQEAESGQKRDAIPSDQSWSIGEPGHQSFDAYCTEGKPCHEAHKQEADI